MKLMNEWMNEFHYLFFFCILFICFLSLFYTIFFLFAIHFVCAFVRKKKRQTKSAIKKRIRCVLNMFLNGFCAINFCFCLRVFCSVSIQSFIHSFIMNYSFWWMTFNLIFIFIVFMLSFYANCFKAQMLTNFCILLAVYHICT